MKLKLHVMLSDAQSNIMTTLQHTGVFYPTRTILHRVEVDIPDPPEWFDIDSITLAVEQSEVCE